MAISTAVSQSSVARAVGIDVKYQDLRNGQSQNLAQRLAIVGQGATSSNYSLDPKRIFSDVEAGNAYGFGSPIHLAAKRLLPVTGGGVGAIPVTVYPLDDETGSAAATGEILPSGTITKRGSFTVNAGSLKSVGFTIEKGASVADITAAITEAVNGSLEMPVTATDNNTDVELISKWKGSSANSIVISIDGPTDTGAVFAITQPTGGGTNPDVDVALSKVGDIWQTMILNCLEIADTDALDSYNVFGEGRWGSLTKKPLVVFTGNNIADVSAATAVSSARASDRINSQLVNPGSDDLPLVTAAAQLAKIVAVADANPPVDYAQQNIIGLHIGDNSDHWLYPKRDQAIKDGSSTVEIKNGSLYLSDIVSFYAPVGETLPSYRYIVDIVRIQNIIHNINTIFESSEWQGAPLIPDGQATVNAAARTPSAAVAQLASLVDSLASAAIISDPDYSKDSIVATLGAAGNPKRLDLCLNVKLSGNGAIFAIDLSYGFYFSQAQGQ